jgi:predicted NAD/FAD-binding protein
MRHGRPRLYRLGAHRQNRLRFERGVVEKRAKWRRGDSLRVAVIGAGIIGAMGAEVLLRKRQDVKLVDPTQPSEGASFGN